MYFSTRFRTCASSPRVKPKQTCLFRSLLFSVIFAHCTELKCCLKSVTTLVLVNAILCGMRALRFSHSVPGSFPVYNLAAEEGRLHSSETIFVLKRAVWNVRLTRTQSFLPGLLRVGFWLSPFLIWLIALISLSNDFKSDIISRRDQKCCICLFASCMAFFVLTSISCLIRKISVHFFSHGFKPAVTLWVFLLRKSPFLHL